jgi:CheY-like chemotaxis protein
MTVGNYLFLPRNDALHWFKVLAVFRCAASSGEQPGFELPPDRMHLRSGKPDGNASILLVDDQELLREAVTEYLAMYGYEVTAMESGGEAMKLLEDGLRPDLVVCDVMLPDIRGGGFVREAKLFIPDLKVLFMSGYGHEAVAEEIGDSQFLQKPFRLDVLVRRVQSILGEMMH